MSDSAQKITEFKRAVHNEGCLQGTVTAIGGLSTFHNSWAKYDFRNEMPKIALEISTDVEDIQLFIPADEILADPIQELINKTNGDITNLINETVYVFPDESFQNAGLGYSQNSNNAGNLDLRVRVTDTQKVKFKGKRVSLLKTWTKSIDKIQNVIDQTIYRDNNKNNWLNVQLTSYENEEETVLKSEHDEIDINASWSFENGIKGTEKMRKFTEKLSVIHALDDQSASVWIKPIWDLDACELQPEMFISDDKYWVICSDIGNARDESIHTKLLRKLKPSAGRKELVFATENVAYPKESDFTDNWHIKQD